MSHHLYTTEGFILGSRPSSEANKIFAILTPELGLVQASAQSIRSQHSKLKGNLLEISHANVTLVRGREVWRLIGAEKIQGLERAFIDQEGLKLTARIFLLLQRFIHGEEKSERLYFDLKHGLEFMDSLVETDYRELLPTIEYVLVLRLLDKLGYLKHDSEIEPLISFDLWDLAMFKNSMSLKNKAIELINLSFEHSHV